MASQSSSQSSTSSTQATSSSFEGFKDPEVRALLNAYLQQITQGGSQDYLTQRANRDKATTDLQVLMRDYTNDAAFSDAADLMKLNLQEALEKNMPALAKSVQGAGTSASSMQGLLSNKIAQDAALSSGALGAEQAKAYAQAMAAMQGVLEGFTRIDLSAEENFIKALQYAERASTAESKQTSTSQSTSNSSQTAPPGTVIGGFSAGANPTRIGGFSTNTGGSPAASSNLNNVASRYTTGGAVAGSSSTPSYSAPYSGMTVFNSDGTKVEYDSAGVNRATYWPAYESNYDFGYDDYAYDSSDGNWWD